MPRKVIPDITISEFKKLKVEQIREMKSLDIICDGEYLGTFVCPHGNKFTKASAQQAALLTNAGNRRLKTPEELMNPAPVVKVKEEDKPPDNVVKDFALQDVV